MTASRVISIGLAAGAVNRADANTFIGYLAGSKNTTGVDNFFIGSGAGFTNTVGSKNLFLGFEAGHLNSVGGGSNTPGDYNTFIGNKSGYSNVSGQYNTYIGAFSGNGINTGARNTMLGQFAGAYCAVPSATSISDNTYIGYSSGSGIALSTGQANNSVRNTFIGSRTGEKKISGNENVFIGHEVGTNNTSGQRNVFIGAFSATNSNVSNSIAIGHSSVPTADNQLAIASSAYPLGTASSGVFSHFLNVNINGVDMKIPLYY
jgi:hypothetical protein